MLKAGAACLVPSAAWGQSPVDDPLQRWIEQNAVRINSGARGAERLIAAIGDSRVVMLGEPSHGAGSAFAAKVRMVQLLHERLGFDVLVWESGLIDLERSEAGLAGDLDPVESAQRGILKIWSASAECRPLFAYAKASHRKMRPLTMAGFDMQLTASGTLDYFAAELRAFLPTEPLAEKVLHYFGHLNRYPEALATKAAELSEGDALPPVAEDLDGLTEAAGALVRLLRETGDPAVGRRGFLIRAITSIAGYGANLFEAYRRHSAEEDARYALTSENRRDRINADNLKWLIDQAYAGRKIMVWAHNAHVMNAWYTRRFDGVSLEPLSDGMKPMGVWLTDWYGDAVYKIGVTTYQGYDGWVGATPEPVPPTPPGSLEERLHRLGASEVFLPLRGQSAPAVSMRIPKYKIETVVKPAQAFDALYFIDAMSPATLI